VNVQPQNQPIDLAHEAAFALGGVEVRPATREAVADEVTEDLEPRVMQVLVALNRRRGDVVSRDELILSCWGGRAVGDDAINRCIARIRRLSEIHGGFSVETIPRVGYRLSEAPSAPNKAISDAAPAETSVRAFRTFHRGLLAGAFVLGAGLLVALAFLVLPAGKAPPPNAVPQRLPSKLTIAVLPFTPLYADPGAQHLGDAIALNIADMLVGTAVEVISPAKAMQFRGAAKAQAAQALKADFLIDGEVQRDEGVFRVATRIVNGHSNMTVIAGSRTLPVAEADNIPYEIAAKLSAFYLIPRRSAGWDSRVIEAYFRASYLEGVRGDFQGAYETAREAARIAPDDAFAQALHGLMAAYVATVLPPDRKPAMVGEAREAAERAIHLDPGYGDSYAVLALIAPTFDWAVRENYLRQGLAISPDAVTAEIKLVDLLQNAGRFRESEPPAENLYVHGSSQVNALIAIINARLWQGQPEVRALITRPGNRVRFWTIPWFAAKFFEEEAFQGAPGDAEAMLREPGARNILDQEGRPTFSRIAVALHYRRPQDIQAVADDCKKFDDLGAEARRTCFVALIVLRRLDDAFWLADRFYPDQRDATWQAREPRPDLLIPRNATWQSRELRSGFLIPPAYLSVREAAPLRADARFRDIVERIGLLNYWKSSHHAPDFCMTERAPVCALLNS
jgi:DNA-binding winged helix-turn-helix (wHTH) protein/TolB-like protein